MELDAKSIQPELHHESPTTSHAAAVLAASIFHFGTYSIGEAKRYLSAAGIPMRLS